MAFSVLFFHTKTAAKHPSLDLTLMDEDRKVKLKLKDNLIKVQVN